MIFLLFQLFHTLRCPKILLFDFIITPLCSFNTTTSALHDYLWLRLICYLFLYFLNDIERLISISFPFSVLIKYLYILTRWFFILYVKVIDVSINLSLFFWIQVEKRWLLMCFEAQNYWVGLIIIDMNMFILFFLLLDN